MPTSTVRDEITAANQRFMILVANGDAAGAARCYTADAEVLPPRVDAVRGSAAIEAFWLERMQAGINALNLETVEVLDFGNHACEVGRYVLETSHGSPIDHGKYIVLWAMEDGAWKLHRDIWNSSVAAR